MESESEVHQLYHENRYPAMSHPLSDPAVTSVAAIMAGLQPPNPRGARIVEIGCSSGHNLIPLAMRWPESQFIGIDLSKPAILEASQCAAAAGATNISFHACDLRDFHPEGPCDYIIAHGFFSWVPDTVKVTLLEFCQRFLSPNGVATVSFNVESGWRARLQVVEKIRAIHAAGAEDEFAALSLFRTLLGPEDPETLIVDDMLAKGREVLPFDDFGPVNDPWPLERFVAVAGLAGLLWLGESDPGDNVPVSVSEADLSRLRKASRDGTDFQHAVDELCGRTFRSGLLCRQDAPVKQRMHPSEALGFSLHLADPGTGRPWINELEADVAARGPSCIPVPEIWLTNGPEEEEALGRLIVEGIYKGRLKPRLEPVRIPQSAPRKPRLDPFRLHCVRERLPLVDVWQIPHRFRPEQYPILEAMDGTRGIVPLANLARKLCRDLDFGAWLRHLAARGFFT